MPNIARIGDLSSHGGHIISGSANVHTNGLLTARTGDLHACPIHGHGITPLISTSHVLVNGLPVVRIGDKAGCGAVIILGAPDVIAE